MFYPLTLSTAEIAFSGKLDKNIYLFRCQIEDGCEKAKSTLKLEKVESNEE